jgi:hypothetical protein
MLRDEDLLFGEGAIARAVPTDRKQKRLRRAMCDLLGFRLEPTDHFWWVHGRNDMCAHLHVRPEFMGYPEMLEVSQAAGLQRAVLVCCTAFDPPHPIATRNLVMTRISDLMASAASVAEAVSRVRDLQTKL